MLCGRSEEWVADQKFKTQHKSVATTLALRATTGGTQEDETGRAKAAGSSEGAELLDVVTRCLKACPGFEA
jgi:hypothetical protein